MRTLLGFLLIVLVLIAASSCGGTNPNQRNPSTSTTANDTVRIANDSLEYEIIIIEPGFNGWLAAQPPRGFRAQSSMDISNDFKVIEYNLRVNNPYQFDPNLYVMRIDYDPQVDYGYEVTYLLFNYFIFFEQRYNQRL